MFFYDFGVEFSTEFDTVNNIPDLIDTNLNTFEPVLGQVVTSDISGTLLIISAIYRYNGQGRFACGVFNPINNDAGTMDVYYDNANDLWKAKEYIPIRYRDEEGVLKGL